MEAFEDIWVALLIFSFDFQTKKCSVTFSFRDNPEIKISSIFREIKTALSKHFSSNTGNTSVPVFVFQLA